ncbi:hypothetical protein GIB67_004188 [Kingdonia uniflora]|uniref:Uncharacterized protein n=1 Tax=Kingdonia uniflora TaxID=39325 RepID=A0A7J7M9Q7_9MAGN|nr:hypothetical protein GIB67_004188 [Kingdonia uniflora]
MKQHSGWIVGDGEDIDLWRDNWCASVPIKELVNNINIPWKQIKANVSYIITKVECSPRPSYCVIQIEH